MDYYTLIRIYLFVFLESAASLYILDVAIVTFLLQYVLEF